MSSGPLLRTLETSVDTGVASNRPGTAGLSSASNRSVLVIEHDMGFVGSIADHVTVLHQGHVLAEGSLDQVQANDQVIEVYLGR